MHPDQDPLIDAAAKAHSRSLPPASPAAYEMFFALRRAADAKYAARRHRGPRPIVHLPLEIRERNEQIDRLWMDRRVRKLLRRRAVS